MTRQSTISYKQIGKLLSLSSQNIFNSRKRQIPELLFCFGIDLQFSSPQNMITNYAKYLPDLRKILRLQDSLLEYVIHYLLH